MKTKRKPITAKKMEAAYRLCLERERIRERDWRRTKQGAFESKTLHFDMGAEEAIERNSSVSWLSDCGRGAAIIRRFGQPTTEALETRWQMLVNKARMAITRHLPDCLKTFRLVLKNETNWKESVWETMKSTSKKHKNGKMRKRSTVHNSKKS